MNHRTWAILRLGLIAIAMFGLAGPLVRASGHSPGNLQVAQLGDLMTLDDDTCDGSACTDDDNAEEDDE